MLPYGNDIALRMNGLIGLDVFERLQGTIHHGLLGCQMSFQP